MLIKIHQATNNYLKYIHKSELEKIFDSEKNRNQTNTFFRHFCVNLFIFRFQTATRLQTESNKISPTIALNETQII